MSNKTEVKKSRPSPTKGSVDLSRRRLAKAGLVVSPILASLPGKSALAGNCTSLSGMLSGNLSSPNGGPVDCGGKITHTFGLSPGYWRTVCTNAHEFPIGYQVRDFLNAFGYGAKFLNIPSDLNEFTLLEALWLKNKHTPAPMSQINLTRHTIAALFSSVTSDQYFIGPEQIIDLYNATIDGGVYSEPVTGVSLTLADVVVMYEDSYVDMGNVTITSNDTFVDCADFVYDDSTGYVYINDLSGTTHSHIRYFLDGSNASK